MDDLEQRIRSGLGHPLPKAPLTLRMRIDALPRVEGVPARSPGLSWQRKSPALALLAFFAMAVVVSGVMFFAGRQVGPARSLGPSLIAPSPTSAPASSFTETPLTVSEFLAGLDASQLDRRSILVRGYWTDRRVPLRCAAPLSPPGALELYCGGDMSGITERNEAIGTLGPGRRWLAATGPAIVPYVPQELRERLFGLPTIHGQPYTPVPIVVRGHVNDPRAVDCRPEAHQMCLERLVIEEIVEFDPNAVPTPGITPSPSPFPFEDPPPAPFTKESCSGDVPYSFIGWGRLRDFGVESGAPNDVVYMMVTAGKVDLSDTGNGPMGRRVCFAYEWDTDGVTFAQLPD